MEQITSPHNRDAEEAVLSCIMINSSAFSDIAIELPDGANEFYIVSNRWTYEACRILITRGDAVDLITVPNELEKNGHLADIGGVAFVMKLATSLGSSTDASSYARIVHEYYVRRLLVQSANDIAATALGGKGDSGSLVSEAMSHVSRVIASVGSKTSVTASESVTIADRQASEMALLDVLPGIATDIPDLTKLLGGGAQKSDLLIVAGRPGKGKTSLLLQLAKHAAYSVQNAKVVRRHVGIFSMEMPHVQLTYRLLNQITGIDFQSIRSGRVPPERMETVGSDIGYIDALDMLSNMDIDIDDSPSMTPERIANRCEIWSANSPLDVVFVDSLNLMRSSVKLGNYNQKHIEVDDNATLLKELVARRYNIPVWCAHQMNRSIEARGDYAEPSLSDLREGGEQPADVVMFIHTEEESASLIVAKHRNGRTGKIPVVFLAKNTKFAPAYRQ